LEDVPGINLLPLGYQEEDTLLPLVVNRRNTWAGNCQAWRGELELLVTHGDRDFDVDSARCQVLATHPRPGTATCLPIKRAASLLGGASGAIQKIKKI